MNCWVGGMCCPSGMWFLILLFFLIATGLPISCYPISDIKMGDSSNNSKLVTKHMSKQGHKYDSKSLPLNASKRKKKRKEKKGDAIE